MSYTEIHDSIFTFYDDKEELLIETWLEEHRYTWWRPTVCGDHCGIFEKCYYLNGICGSWKSTDDKNSFIEYATKNNIPFNTEKIELDCINPRVDNEN